MATKKLTTIVIDALEDIKARDIKLINVSKLTSVFDYIAIASADSTRQTKALAKNVMDRVKESGGWIYGIEGEQSGEWVLVDCGDIVVHIMQPAMRELYEGYGVLTSDPKVLADASWNTVRPGEVQVLAQARLERGLPVASSKRWVTLDESTSTMATDCSPANTTARRLSSTNASPCGSTPTGMVLMTRRSLRLTMLTLRSMRLETAALSPRTVS